MLIFTTETARLQYTISAHEVLRPHGPMIAYVQVSGRYYEPTSAGRGPSKWAYLGTSIARAHGGVRTVRRNEAIVARETVLSGDDRYVVGDLTLDGELVIGATGQVVFVQESGGRYVGPDDQELIWGELELDGEARIDGEIVFMPSVQESSLPLVPLVVAEGTTLTIPADYGLPAANLSIKVDGQIIVNGVIA